MADRVLIAISYYYRHISEELLAGATEVLEKAGAKVTVMEVPGAFEIPGVIAMAADSGRFDGAVAAGGRGVPRHGPGVRLAPVHAAGVDAAGCPRGDLHRAVGR